MTSSVRPRGVRNRGQLTGWHVLAILVVFFGATFAVDAVMIGDAYKTFSGEVATSPYEDGLAYDSQLDQQRAQASLGWRMTIGLAGRVIRLRAADAHGHPLTGLRFAASLERPATERGHRAIAFKGVSPGLYEADAGALSGAWDIRVSAVDAAHRRFDAERRLIAP